MTDAVLVLRKLSRLRDHLDRLKRRGGVSKEEFMANLDLQTPPR